MTRFVGRALSVLIALTVAAGALSAASLYLSGQPLFGLLAGTGASDAVPQRVRELLASDDQTANNRPEGRARAVRVRAARIQKQAVPSTLSFSGRLLAPRQVEVRARVSGYVSSLNFKEGEVVEKGQTLYQIDPRTFDARVAQLEAALKGAETNLAFLKRETDRIADLEEQQYAETSRLDELTSQRDQAAARIDELGAQLRQARLDREFATVQAPFAGKIGFSEVDEGDLVREGQTRLVTLVDFHPIEVEFRPNAEQLARMKSARARLGRPLRLTVSPDGRGAKFSGEVTALGPAVQNATNTVPVRGEVPNQAQKLVPGQFVRVTVQLGTQRRLLAPTAALVTQQDRRALYVLSDQNTVETVPVEIGKTIGDRVVVLGDVAGGDRVVTGNLQAVRPGRPVRIIAQQDGNGAARSSASEGRMN